MSISRGTSTLMTHCREGTEDNFTLDAKNCIKSISFVLLTTSLIFFFTLPPPSPHKSYFYYICLSVCLFVCENECNMVD